MKKIIILGVVSLAVFMFIKAPAFLLLPYLNSTPYVQVKNIEGSIFSAKAQTTGKIDNLSYQLNPWQLLLANFSVNITAQKGGSRIQGVAGVNLITQKITLKHLTGDVNLALFEEYMPELSTIEPRGQLLLKGVDIVWDDVQNNPIPQHLSGKIDVLKLQVLEQDFGGYTALFTTKTPTNIVGEINHHKSAQVNADIKLNLLDDKKQLMISGVVSGNTPNTKAILQQLNVANIVQTIRY